MAKAVLITVENRESLILQYDYRDSEELVEPGYYLVAGFGDEGLHEGILHKDILDENFIRTGKTLNNDFFEVEAI